MRINDKEISVQGSEAWLLYRSAHLNASEAAIILGVSPYSTPYELWHSRSQEAVYTPVSAAMQKGKDNETAILAEFESRHACFMMPAVYEYDEDALFSASLDGISSDGKELVEIKYTNKEVFELAKQGIVAEHYRLQVQQQLMCSGAEKGYFFVYNPTHRDYAEVEVFPDPETWERIRKAGREFWKLLERGVAPEMSDDDKAYVDNEIFHTKEQELADIQEKIAYLQEQEKKAKQELIDFCETHHKGRVSFGTKFTITPKVRMSYKYKAACEDHGINLEKYKSETSYTEVRKHEKV